MSLRRLSKLFTRSSSRSLSSSGGSQGSIKGSEEERQVLIIGLDDAGKTSVYNSLCNRKLGLVADRLANMTFVQCI